MEKGITAFIPAHIQNKLHPGETGEIILVSSAGIYLRFPGQILLLCDRKWGVLPIGIGIEDFEHAAAQLRPRQGQQVRMSEDLLMFPSGNIRLMPQDAARRIGSNLPVQLQYVRQTALELAALHKTRGISMLVLPLVLGRAADGILKENPYCAHGYPYFSTLMTAIDRGDSREIALCAEKLLGLGLGLTPSADDVLLGMLYVFRTVPHRAPAGAQMLSESIAQLSDRCTNQISAAYLKAVLAGAPYERMEQVFCGLCGGEVLEIEKLTQIGSSSGSEMLLGMLLALKSCGFDVSLKEELP